MGIAERKERQKAELRDTILAAARRIFIDEGAEALTMRRIAEAIEYSPGALYLYFESREEIALQLVREGFDKLMDALRPAVAGITDPVERIRAIARAYVEFGLTDPETYKLIFMGNARNVYAVLEPADPGSPGTRADSLVASSVAEAIACGAFRPIDPARAADAIWSALHGAISLHITCPALIGDPRTIATLCEDTMIAGMRA